MRLGSTARTAGHMFSVAFVCFQFLAVEACNVVDGQKYWSSDSGEHRSSGPQILDGGPLDFSTFIGGTGLETVHAVVSDQSGAMYLAGSTDSVDFPVIPGSYDETYNLAGDAFVVKIAPGGTGIVYATYVGGSSQDDGRSIAVDAAGNVFLAGTTRSIDFPTTPGAYDRTLGGTTDSFLVGLNPDGTRAAFSTFLGGSGSDFATALKLDLLQMPVVVGFTRSPDFPTTPGAYDNSSNDAGLGDIYVSRLSANGSALILSTFVGGSGQDNPCNSFDIDPSGSLLLAGWTNSSDFPTTPGAYDRSLDGPFDSFATALLASGTSLAYSTYLGGSNFDRTFSASAGNSGGIILAGETWSADFPTTPGSFDSSYNGGSSDAFVAHIDMNGTRLLLGTFLGGSGTDEAYALSTGDKSGAIYVAGVSDSTNFPVTSGAFDVTYNGKLDAVLGRLDRSGKSLEYSTFLGGGAYDAGLTLFMLAEGVPAFAGATESPDFPVTQNATDPDLNGTRDGYVSFLNLEVPPVVVDSHPKNSTTDIRPDTTMQVEFNVEMNPTTTSSAFSLAPTLAGSVVAVNGTRLSVSHTTPLTPGTSYTGKVAANATSALGIKMAFPFSFSFTVASHPKVIVTNPADGEVNVSTNVTLRIVFDHSMEPNSTINAFNLNPPAAGTVSANGSIFEWVPTPPLEFGTRYSATIAKSAQSSFGVPLSSPFALNFTTRMEPRPTVPQIVSTTPKEGSTQVSVSQNLSILFSVPMESVSTSQALSTSPEVPQGMISVEGSFLNISHATPFHPSTRYVVRIAPDARSTEGVALGREFLLNFTTQIAPAIPPQVQSTTPSNGESGVALDTVVVVLFNLEMDAVRTSRAFSVTPAVPGLDVQVLGQEIRASTSTLLSPDVEYTVMVTGDAASRDFVQMGIDFQFRFRTRPMPSMSEGPWNSITNPQVLGISILILIILITIVFTVLRSKRKDRKPE